MDFLNKIGQRNAAKYLVNLALFSSICIFFIKHFGKSVTGAKSGILEILFGTFLLCLPHILLLVNANKSRIYRLSSVICSGMLYVINMMLFIFSLFYTKISVVLFGTVFMEIIFTLIFYIYVSHKEKEKMIQRSKEKTNKKNVDLEKTNTTEI